ncbi:hypothetical protein J7443_24295 [Tropicibacter sp. R15_0]|uniref:immunity protein Imm33 domain-containing protein n=1 Tax=Tropicibacter sp. R15_0 TaxID=2821101 RepID=UPI001ADA2A94|nr:hypothetical protein [Tropicibacter sp. R15_0]MBO9468367.1 hypothetical protein [Tropicibacter sp. R15_0]
MTSICDQPAADLLQQAKCALWNTEYVALDWKLKAGVEISTFSQNWPLNGLRHAEENGTNGWYIWGGETFPTADDAFAPYHGGHLLTLCPDIVPFLGLPPGFRFLIAPGYEDIWFDQSLLAH